MLHAGSLHGCRGQVTPLGLAVALLGTWERARAAPYTFQPQGALTSSPAQEGGLMWVWGCLEPPVVQAGLLVTPLIYT